MPRNKVTCFYCGVSNQRSARDTPRRFECPNCQATNHFDQNGEITDFVPTPPRNPAPQYAHRVSPKHSAAGSTNAQSIFCKSCQNNQIIIVQRLADYLPDESHPNYDDYVDSLPEFRSQLEDQYPPICPRCAPIVNETIRKTNYKTKVAGLGKLLKNTNQMIKSGAPTAIARRKTWGLVMWLKAGFWGVWGLAYVLSLLLLMFWHLSATLYPVAIPPNSDLSAATWPHCFKQSVLNNTLDPSCYIQSSKIVGRLYPYAIVLSFWDYKWLEVNRSPGAYLRNRSDYYISQLLVSITILLNWFMLAPGGFIKDKGVFEKANLGFFMLEILTIWAALTSLKVAHPRRITLKEAKETSVPGSLSSAPPVVVQDRLSSTQSLDHVDFQSDSGQRSFSSSISRPEGNFPATRMLFAREGRNQSTGKTTTSSTWRNNRDISQPLTNTLGALHGTLQPTRVETLQQRDPDEMDWNPISSISELEIPSNSYSFGSSSFSEHRSSSPIGQFPRRKVNELDIQSPDGFSTDEDDGSPTKPTYPTHSLIQPRKLFADASFDVQTGLEGLFEVATKLEDVVPKQSKKSSIKHYRKNIEHIVRFVVVSICLTTEVECTGWKSFFGLVGALVFGTCWRVKDTLALAEGNSVAKSWTWRSSMALSILELTGGAVQALSLFGLLQFKKDLDYAVPDLYIPTQDPELLSGQVVSTSTHISTSHRPQQASIALLASKLYIASLLFHQTFELAKALFHHKSSLSKPDKVESDVQVSSERQRRKSNDWGISQAVAAPWRRPTSPSSLGNEASRSSFGGLLLSSNTTPSNIQSLSQFQSVQSQQQSQLALYNQDQSHPNGSIQRPASPFNPFGGAAGAGIAVRPNSPFQSSITNFGQKPKPVFGQSTVGVHVPARGVEDFKEGERYPKMAGAAFRRKI